LKAGGELVIADSGSSDGTLQLAKRAGCRVLNLGNRFLQHVTAPMASEANSFLESEMVDRNALFFDFSGARNAAAAACKSDYVLVLDIHETLGKIDIAGINALLSPSSVLLSGKHRSIRVYDRRAWNYIGRVQETLNPSVANPGQNVIVPDHVLNVSSSGGTKTTYSYIYSIFLDMIEHPRMHRYCFYLGRYLYHMGAWKAALKVFLRGEQKTTGWNAEISQGLCYAGQCYEKLDFPLEAEQCYLRALKQDASRREPWIRLAFIAKINKNYVACRGFAYAALAQAKSGGLPEPEENFTFLPHDLIYWSCSWLNKSEEGYPHWKVCVKCSPTDKRYVDDAKFFKNQIEKFESQKAPRKQAWNKK